MKTKPRRPAPVLHLDPSDPANPVLGTLDLVDDKGRLTNYYLIQDAHGVYVLEKYGTQGGERYTVDLRGGDDSEATCTCRGHQTHRRCKHTEDLCQLRRAERI